MDKHEKIGRENIIPKLKVYLGGKNVGRPRKRQWIQRPESQIGPSFS